MRRIAFTNLLKIELPTRDVLLCDGGFQRRGDDVFMSRDELFGIVTKTGEVETGAAESLPTFDITFNPAAGASAGALTDKSYKNAPVTYWLTEYDPDTGELTDPDEKPQFAGMLNAIDLEQMRDERALHVSIVSSYEKLGAANRGNSLSSTAHKSIWPGELGHDNATGFGIQVAWGTIAPPRNSPAGATMPTDLHRWLTL